MSDFYKMVLEVERFNAKQKILLKLKTAKLCLEIIIRLAINEVIFVCKVLSHEKLA